MHCKSISCVNQKGVNLRRSILQSPDTYGRLFKPSLNITVADKMHANSYIDKNAGLDISFTKPFCSRTFKASQLHHSVYFQQEKGKPNGSKHFCIEMHDLLYWSRKIVQFHSLFLKAACTTWFKSSRKQSIPMVGLAICARERKPSSSSFS